MKSNIKIVIPPIKKSWPFKNLEGISVLFWPVSLWPSLPTDQFKLFIPIINQDYESYFGLKYHSDAVLSPTREMFEICLDKEVWYNFFKDKNLQSYFTERNPKTFPQIIKPKVGYHSKGVKVIYEPESVPPAFFTEEYIEGKEYSSDIIFSPKKGIVKALTVAYPKDVVGKIRKIRDDRLRANWLKRNYIYHTDLSSNILDQISEVLLALNWTGLINLNFKIKNDTIKIFDINSSWSGTSVLHVEKIIKSLIQLKN
jgi:predicted ATP-grasp superfamily ATP-dependent carboligase